jgi:CDP-glucose 4,6-dehydratase
MFNNIYKDKKVLITGHTGFKGTWLTTWLLKLGAKIIGISNDIPTDPSMFKELKLEKEIKHHLLDVRNFKEVHEIIETEKPDFIFHLAAQAIVSTSYVDPLETISSNVIGTAHVLESLRLTNHKCSAIIITSDKAYDNVEQVWGYKENDVMGGKDVYSGSKGAADLIIKSYYHSFFKNSNSNVRICTARAGNVIGGGDWAKDRIMVDAMIAWSKSNKVEIRSPNATRPWQHVLEPLSGYLSLGEQLFFDKSLTGEAFNFGPLDNQNITVHELLVDSCKYWGIEPTDAIKITDDITFHEAGLLKLNCDKASAFLRWNANLDYEDTVRYTNEWYYHFYSEDLIFDKTLDQISEYEDLALSKILKWTE